MFEVIEEGRSAGGKSINIGDNRPKPRRSGSRLGVELQVCDCRVAS